MIALIIIFIVLGIKVIKFISKMNGVIDDVEKSIQKTNNMFSVIDKIADYTSNISDRLIGGIFNFVSRIFKRKGNDTNE